MPSAASKDDEKIFCDRVMDAVNSANNRSVSKFIGFLDERQQLLAVEVCRKLAFDQYCLNGGYPEATRKLLGVFADYIDIGDSSATDALFAEEFCCVTLAHYRGDHFTHRDVLGALMGLGLQRSAVGDILVGDNGTALFVRRTVADTVCSELQRVGRVPVRCALGLPDPLPYRQEYQELHGTVGSARADCVVAFVSNLAREKAAALIHSGMVSLNYQVLESLHTAVRPDDILAVRGVGKFKVASIGGLTRKGRTAITCKKYI